MAHEYSFNWRRKAVSYVFIIAMLLVAAGSEASPKNRLSFGVYTGWSFGLGYEFDWHIRPYSDRYSLDFHLGGYVQYNISELLGAQINVNYQHGAYDWDLSHPSFPHKSGTEGFDFVSFDLDCVLNFLRWKRMEFYALGGGGITSGEWNTFAGTYFNLNAGGGVKIFLSKSHPGLALTISGTFTLLLNPEEDSTYSADYLRFQVGIEF